MDKISQQTDKGRHTQQALQNFVESETKRREQVLSKTMEKNHSNREAYLRNLRDKLREKENHAQVVRENKRNMVTERDSTEP